MACKPLWSVWSSGSGATLNKAINVLQSHGADVKNLIFLNLFATHAGLRTVTLKYPEVLDACMCMYARRCPLMPGAQMHIVTSGIVDNASSINFSTRYFGA